MKISEFQALTGYNKRHIYRMIENGDLKVKKVLGQLEVEETPEIRKLLSFKKIITVEQASEIMGYTTQNIRCLVKEGMLDGARIGKKGRFYIDYYSIPTNIRQKYEKMVLEENRGRDNIQTIINTLAFVKLNEKVREELLIRLYKLLKKRYVD